VNIGVVSRIISKLLMIEGVSMLLPMLVGLFYGEQDYIYFLGVGLVCVAVGFAGSCAWKKKDKSRTIILVRDGIAIVTFGWILFSFFGGAPFYLSGYIPNVSEAFFETVSGFTTTGASVLSSVEALSKCMLFWRSFTHWLGGMGILVFTVAILPGLDVGSFQIMKAECSGPVSEKIMPRVKDAAKTLYLIYMGFTLVEIVLLMLGGMDWFEASTHTFGTVGTGGFGIYNDSTARFSAFSQWVITIFMLLCNVNFSLYYLVLRGRWREVVRDEETRFFFLVVLGSGLLITIDLVARQVFAGGVGDALRHAYFQVGTVISTTGFATCDFDLWPSFSKTVLFVLFFFGGCAGSTGGGPKSIRVLVALKVVKQSITKIVHPRAVAPVKVNGKPVKEETINVIFGFLAMYAIFMMLGTAAVTALEDVSIFDGFMMIAATLGNVGPGFGVVGPTCNYGGFSDLTTWILSFMMLAGRLEIYTVIALFFPSFWKK
jgi:trk system potassium uptake protein TrkH